MSVTEGEGDHHVGTRAIFIFRPLVTGFLLVGSAIPCFGTAAPGPGETSGTVTVDGSAVALKHAYAVVELDLESRETVASIVTDRPVPETAWSHGTPLRDLLGSGEAASGLHVRLVEGGMPEGWKVVHPDLSTGCGVYSDWKADLTARTPAAVTGRLQTTKKETAESHAFEFDGEFNAEVKLGWEATAKPRATPDQRAVRRALRESGAPFPPSGFTVARLVDPGTIGRFLEADIPPDTVSPDTADTALIEIVAPAEISPESASAALALVRAGADVNRRSRQQGDTPLARAVGSVEIVKALLDAGADMRARAAGSATPLMTAVFMGRPENVRAILDAGYDAAPELETLLPVASAHPEIAKMLKGAGARKR